MYMREPAESFNDVRITPAIKLALFIAAVGTLYLGILPSRILEWTAQSVLR